MRLQSFINKERYMLRHMRHIGGVRLEIVYFLKGIVRRLNIAPTFFYNLYKVEYYKNFKNKWLKRDGEQSYFDFGNAKLPDVSDSKEKLPLLMHVFEDVFMFPCFLNDDYHKDIVKYYDRYMIEGPYGYTDGSFDVTVKKGDIVIDAGAWIGDFSAYVASKGAMAYAFEPVSETFQWLCKTQSLNNVVDGEGGIHPVRKGLSSSECETDISIFNNNSGANSIITEHNNVTERITVTTLDKFVEENYLKRVDFIKADIEGAEREMLRGATNVLRNFAPKLVICTYHLPDDPEVLEAIIKEANSAYKVVHLRHKLFAAVLR